MNKTREKIKKHGLDHVARQRNWCFYVSRGVEMNLKYVARYFLTEEDEKWIEDTFEEFRSIIDKRYEQAKKAS